MGRPTVCIQAACRLIELALTGYALRYFAESGRSDWFWLAIAAASFGQQAAAAATLVCLRQLEGSSERTSGESSCGGRGEGGFGKWAKFASSHKPALAATAQCLLCGDIWWFFELVVQTGSRGYGGDRGRDGGGPAGDLRYKVYALCRLLTAAASSVPLSIIAASAYVREPHPAPGLCALTSAATVAVTWANFHNYDVAVNRAREYALRALAFIAKASVALSRLSAVSRAVSTVAGAWIAVSVLFWRVAVATLFSVARGRHCRRQRCRRRLNADDCGSEVRWLSRAAQLVRAVAYCCDLLLLSEECTRLLIVAYYSLVLLESCALAAAWYAVVGGDGEAVVATPRSLLWLVCEFVSLTFGVLMTVLHSSAAAKATETTEVCEKGTARYRQRAGERTGGDGDVTPATDDYEWDPYDGDIRRRASYTNAAFELECPQMPPKPPLAIVLPYSAFDCHAQCDNPPPLHRADPAPPSAMEKNVEHPRRKQRPPQQQQQQQHIAASAALASPRALGDQDVAAAPNSGGCPDAGGGTPRAASTKDTTSNDNRSLGSATTDCQTVEGNKASLPLACAAESERSTAEAVTGSDLTCPTAVIGEGGGGWGFEHNVAYLNCGFVSDDDRSAAVGNVALPRYLPHAPRGVFTTRWHSASYGLNLLVGGGEGAVATATQIENKPRCGARSTRTLPGGGGDRWRRKASSDGCVLDDTRTTDRPAAAACIAQRDSVTSSAAETHACHASRRLSVDGTATAPPDLPQLEQLAEAASSATRRAPEHWVRRWLRLVVSRRKSPVLGGGNPDFAPDTLF